MIASLDLMLRVALIPRGVINHDKDKPSCIQSKRYPIRGGLAEKQRLAQSCFVLYLKVFKNHLHYLWHVRVLSLDILNLVYIHSFRSIKKLPKSFSGLGAFDHLEWTHDGAFEQLFGLGRGEFEQKFSTNSNARGVAREGMLKLRFDWYIIRVNPTKG